MHVAPMTGLIPFPDISPDIFSVSLFGMTIALRWYALAYIVGILAGWRLVVSAVKRPTLWRNDTPPMTTTQIEDLLTWIIIGVILGGRLGYVLFYQPAYYLANPMQILAIWQGVNTVQPLRRMGLQRCGLNVAQGGRGFDQRDLQGRVEPRHAGRGAQDVGHQRPAPRPQFGQRDRRRRALIQPALRQ